MGAIKKKNSSSNSISLEKRSTVEEASHLVLFLHQHIRNEKLTKRVAGDIWHLAAPQKEYKIWQHLKKDIKWRALTPIPIAEEELFKSKMKKKRSLKKKIKAKVKAQAQDNLTHEVRAL